jgi:hypothetical protein
VPLLQLQLLKRRDKSAARGRYERLAVPLDTPNEFARTANFLCSAAQGIADICADLNERLADVLHGHTGLDWLQLWDNNAGYDQCLDDHCSPQQDQYFPQP